MTEQQSRAGADHPRGSHDLDFERFVQSFAAWKEATVRFEAAVHGLRAGDAAARHQAQDLARELARLHHTFMESSQPYFQASKE